MFRPIDPASRFDPRFLTQQLDMKAPLDTWWIGDKFNVSDECKTALASMKLKPGDFWYGNMMHQQR
jgi:hypothetical protein